MTNMARPRTSLGRKEYSQTFMGRGPTVYLLMKIVKRILTGIIGMASWVIFSLGTPFSIILRLVIESEAENPNENVKRTTTMTWIRGWQSIFQSTL
jgi:hypothetical protein